MCAACSSRSTATGPALKNGFHTATCCAHALSYRSSAQRQGCQRVGRWQGAKGEPQYCAVCRAGCLLYRPLVCASKLSWVGQWSQTLCSRQLLACLLQMLLLLSSFHPSGAGSAFSKVKVWLGTATKLTRQHMQIGASLQDCSTGYACHYEFTDAGMRTQSALCVCCHHRTKPAPWERQYTAAHFSSSPSSAPAVCCCCRVCLC